MAKYIEKEALIAHIEKDPLYPLIEKYGIKRVIEAFPATDVVPVRRGRWIETTQPLGWRDEPCAECSVCGEDFVLDEWGIDDMKNLMPYCPNCGARMEISIPYYTPEVCDGHYCPMDCEERCPLADEAMEKQEEEGD